MIMTMPVITVTTRKGDVSIRQSVHSGKRILCYLVTTISGGGDKPKITYITRSKSGNLHENVRKFGEYVVQ